MPDPEADRPHRLHAPLAALAAGAASSELALMRLLLEAQDAAEAEQALQAALAGAEGDAAARLGAGLTLLRDHPGAFATVRGIADGLAHDRPSSVAQWAEVFDRAARVSPEGSVALYSLGSPERLAAATGEVVEVLRGWGLVEPGRRVVDIGCGIGRFESALAAQVAEIIGIDIAPGMIAEARRRCADLPNVRFVLGSGQDLEPIGDDSVDLVLAVDSFPYLVLAGENLVERHVAEAGRVLGPGGDLVILNLSYRGDPAADGADLRKIAARQGFRVIRDGERPFRLWDGLAFHLRRERVPEADRRGG